MTLPRIAPWRCVAPSMLLAAGLVGAPDQNSVRRDWGKYPAVVEIDTTADIFAVGDVHSDYQRLAKLLAAAKVIDGVPAAPETVTWLGGQAIVVFTGDLIDKGPNALGTIALLGALRGAAARAGGQVVTLMGNHEAEFLNNPDSIKGHDFAVELKGRGIEGKDVAACRGDVGRFLCSMPFAARVNDWFFSHAGNTGGRTIVRLASDLQHGVDQDGFGTEQLVGENSLLMARLGESGPGGKSWFETETPRRSGQQLLAAYAAALGVSHIVEGHQPAELRFQDGVRRKTGEMFQRYGLIFLIDTGMSRDVGDSAGAILHIQTTNGQMATAICASGKTTRLWDDRRKQETGRAAPCRL